MESIQGLRDLDEGTKKAHEIADKLTTLGRELGAASVVVAVSIPTQVTTKGVTDTCFWTAWSGESMCVRGLAEIMVDKVRQLFEKHRL